MSPSDLRAARVNRVFRTDESKGGLGWLLSKIADCARMCFSSAHNR
jgi:hypothetical protein